MVMDIKSLVPGQTSLGLNKSEKSKNKRKSGGSSDASASSEDSINITGKASQISQLIQQMKASPAVDLDRTSPIKEKVDDGSYEIEYQQVANKMLDFESSYYK